MAYQFANNGTLKDMTAEELAAADSDSSVIELNQGTLEDGTPYWVFIAVKPSKYKEYKRLTAACQPILLTDYGNILKFGYDTTVPETAKQEMKSEYNWDDNFLAVLAADIKKAQGVFLKQQEEQRIEDIVSMLKQSQSSS